MYIKAFKETVHADSESVTPKNVKKATCKKSLHSKRDLLVQYCKYLILPLSLSRDKRGRKEVCWVRNADQGVISQASGRSLLP